MTSTGVVGIALSGVLLLAALGRGLWLLHKGVDFIQTLSEKVHSLETTLSNGIRADVREALKESREARRLAGVAATAAATAQQRVAETTENTARAVNALRAEINTYTNVAVQDTAHIWESLSSLGIDRRNP